MVSNVIIDNEDKTVVKYSTYLILLLKFIRIFAVTKISYEAQQYTICTVKHVSCFSVIF